MDEDSPSNFTLIQRATLLWTDGDLDRAELLHLQALQHDEDELPRVVILHRYGHLLIWLGRPDEAIQRLSEAAALGDDVDSQRALGDLFILVPELPGFEHEAQVVAALVAATTRPNARVAMVAWDGLARLESSPVSYEVANERIEELLRSSGMIESDWMPTHKFGALSLFQHNVLFACPDSIKHRLALKEGGSDDVVAIDLSDPTWLSVEEYIDAGNTAKDRVSYGDFTVTYSDEIAHARSGLVAESVSVIESFSGVERADRTDRELILVWGKQVDLALLAQDLRTWWRRRIEDTNE